VEPQPLEPGQLDPTITTGPINNAKCVRKLCSGGYTVNSSNSAVGCSEAGGLCVGNPAALDSCFRCTSDGLYHPICVYSSYPTDSCAPDGPDAIFACGTREYGTCAGAWGSCTCTFALVTLSTQPCNRVKCSNW